MRSCTGAVGSKKHLPLPANVIKALPHLQRSGAAPVEVVVTFLAETASAAATGAVGCRDTAMSEEHITCLVGPTGSHGCTALQVPVSRAMNGRRLLHITLRTDLTIELGLGERVEMSAAATHDRERAARMAATFGGGDMDVGVDGTITETLDGGVIFPAATGTVQRQRGSSGGVAVMERGDGMATRPCKRRRSSSASPCESAAVGDIATIAAAAMAPPLSPPPRDGCGNISEGKTVFQDTDALKDLAAMAARAGLTMEALEALRRYLLVQQQQEQQHGKKGAPSPGPPPPPPLPRPQQPHPQPHHHHHHQQQQQQQHLQLQPLQRRRSHPAAISVGVSGPAAAVTTLPVRRRQPYPPSTLSPYGMPAYVQTAFAAGQPIGSASVENTAPVLRRMLSAAPPRCIGASDLFEPVHARQSQSHVLEDAGPPAPRRGVAAAPAADDDERPEPFSGPAVLSRTWGLIQQVPGAQISAAQALAIAAAQSNGAAGPEAAAVLNNFRACLAGILGLLMRAREAAVADLAAQIDGSSTDGAAAATATGSVHGDLLAAAPAMLNAAECLLEWYGLLAAASDEHTAVSYAAELASSAALVKAQLAHELAPLAVLVGA
ncbi:hypothetical protein Vafri_12420 [Volvox africanus]|nr:hypothetical protein Vafri_12420 [Volvox africanus]